jgi:tetratricopeptide (TPR) repeat protein
VLAGLGRYDDAIAEYRTAVRLAPGLIEAHQDLAAAYAATGRFTAAAETAAQALALARAAGRDDLTATLETRLVQYRAGVPGS